LDKIGNLSDINVSYRFAGQDPAGEAESADWMEQVRNLNAEYTLRTGKVKTYKLDVFGCQMNERDA